MDKFSELKAAAGKYSLTLNAHRQNPRDIDAIRAWDEADAELSRVISHNETDIIIALLVRIEELEKKEAWRERQSVIDGLAGAGEAWSDIEEYMIKWDEERRNG